MKTVSRRIRLALFIFLLGCVLAPPAHAYLDAGSGSMMIQLLLAGAAGLILGLKMFWHRILVFLGLAKPASSEPRKPSSRP